MTIPASVEIIDDEAFADCPNLTVDVPQTVKYVGDDVIRGTRTAFEKSEAEREAKEKAKQEKIKRDFEIEDGILKKYKGSEEIVEVPSFVTSIGLDAFYCCKSLEEITIPSLVTEIGEYAFCGCKSLEEITIPSSVTEIGDVAFYSCENLEEITIPSSVTKIGDDAFERCNSLTQIRIPSSLSGVSRLRIPEKCIIIRT